MFFVLFALAQSFDGTILLLFYYYALKLLFYFCFADRNYTQDPLISLFSNENYYYLRYSETSKLGTIWHVNSAQGQVLIGHSAAYPSNIFFVVVFVYMRLAKKQKELEQVTT